MSTLVRLNLRDSLRMMCEMKEFVQQLENTKQGNGKEGTKDLRNGVGTLAGTHTMIALFQQRLSTFTAAAFIQKSSREEEEEDNGSTRAVEVARKPVVEVWSRQGAENVARRKENGEQRD